MSRRNLLDQGHKLSLYRLILDGGVGTQQSHDERAVEKKQAVDLRSLTLTTKEKRHVNAKHLGDLL